MIAIVLTLIAVGLGGTVLLGVAIDPWARRLGLWLVAVAFVGVALALAW